MIDTYAIPHRTSGIQYQASSRVHQHHGRGERRAQKERHSRGHDPGLSHAHYGEWLEKLAPYRENYRHHRTGETNGDSHLKSLLVHHQVIVPVTDGRLDFGPWQQVYYAEFDGQRPKRVIIKVMGE
jgi:hypothetical protein